MLRALAAASATLVLAVAPAAAQAKSYKGKTNQGKVATVTTAGNGVVSRARVVWTAKCRSRRVYRESTTFRAPLDAATGDMVQDAGTYRQKLVRGMVGKITISVAGRRDPARDRWTGTLAVRVVVTHKGKFVDRCTAARITWRAK